MTSNGREKKSKYTFDFCFQLFVYLFVHSQPKLTLRTAHKLDCFFHAMHNNDIGTLCIMMTSAAFKSLYGNATKRLKLPQIRKKSK